VLIVSAMEAFYEPLLTSATKAQMRMQDFAFAHPEIAAFVAWAHTAPWTSSYAGDRFNSLNSFILVDRSGAERAERYDTLLG
jgi:catalase